MRKNSYGLKLMTFVVLTMCFSILSGGVLVLKNLESILTSWGQDLQMTVYLDQAHTEDDILFIRKKLSRYNGIEAVTHVNQESALEQFRVQMSSYAPDLLKDPELVQMIPASLEVKFKADLHGQEQLELMNTIKEDLKDVSRVEEVSYGKEWVQKYTQINEFFRGIVAVLSVAIGMATLFVISNVIQISIRQRRAEIEVLELLGATANTIRRPFLVEGMKIGLISMILSLLANWTLLKLILEHFSGTLQLLRMNEMIHFLDLKTILILIIFGPLLGFLASFFCLRKINTGWAAAGRRA